VEQTPPDYLSVMGRLAREYEEKSNQIHDAFLERETGEKVQAALQLSERTTARFRGGQAALFAMLNQIEGGHGAQVAEAIAALSSCFDEMRILLNFLAQECSG
jgi:hypothetical protein